MHLDPKNPLRKYYSQYTGLSFENMQLKTVFAAHLQSTLQEKASKLPHDLSFLLGSSLFSLYHIFRQEKPFHKCYLQYTSVSCEKIELKTGYVIHAQSTLLKKVSP